MIPKIIHYCWFGNNPKGLLIEKCMATWKAQLPGWEIKEWSESNSPISEPYVARALKEKRFAFAADYVRFHALFFHGGIYLDTDMEIVRDLTPLLSDEFFIGRESEDYINAGIIGATKGHPLMSCIMKEFDNRATTGFTAIPEVITPILAEKTLTSKGVRIYPPEFFYPYNPFDKNRKDIAQLFYCDVSNNTYAIHHWAQSWSYTFSERLLRKFKRLIWRVK
jgi:mannosyltransferase OCH1-like enzyme